MKRIKLILSTVMFLMAVGVSAQTTEWVVEGKSFTDGTLLYTLGTYNVGSNSTITLDDGQVAVSLYLQETTDESLVLSDITYADSQPQNGNGITYTSEGSHTAGSPTSSSTRQRNFYKRTIQLSKSNIKINTATSVTIPATINDPNGNSCDVVAIPWGGFCIPELYTMHYRNYCTSGSTSESDIENPSQDEITDVIWMRMQGHNPFLQEVNFAPDSKITNIGEYAFVGCVNLQDIEIPKTVTTLGTGCFELCYSLKKVTFQTESNSLRSALRTVSNYVFYGDDHLRSIIFPEGLTSIGDYALIYNMALTEIKLPNSLESVGAHFLCDASSLETLTVPANCTFINGAFLHGCSSLRSVYMLGYARNLNVETAQRDGMAFDYNNSFCKDHVNKCTFYVPQKYLEDYQKHDVWRLIDDEGNTGTIYDSGKPGYYNWWGTWVDDPNYPSTHTGYKNRLAVLPGTEREFEPNKWVTAIFPKVVENYQSESLFGEKARFAKYIGAERIADAYDESVGHMVRMYNLRFEIMKETDGSFTQNIPAGTPGMFYTGKGYKVTDSEGTVHGYELWKMDDETEEFTKDMTNPHSEESGFTAENDPDNAFIFMSGYYVPYTMKDYDFYFSANKFWRVPEGTNVEIGTCRCFWTVMIGGLPATASAKPSRFFDETTGIGTITIAVDEPTEVYDLSGRKLNATDKLKSGIYIINGKKVVVK